MTASIEDVARLAGVSIATVSRSLRGLPDVAAGTRDRVLAAARELDYVASPFAARLASGRTATVGVVVPFVNRWYFAEVLGAIEAVLHDAGFDLLLYNLGDPAGRDRFFTEMPARKRVDALVVASLVLTEPETELLRALGVPVGVLGVEHDQFFCTRIDDHQGASRRGRSPARARPPPDRADRRRDGRPDALHSPAPAPDAATSTRSPRPASTTSAASRRSATSPSPAARRRRPS